MYFDIRAILKLEKECRHPSNRHLDLRDYFDLRTAKVLSFTSFQKLYIQDQFNVVHSLNLKDFEVHKRHEELNGNWRSRFDCFGERIQPTRKLGDHQKEILSKKIRRSQFGSKRGRNSVTNIGSARLIADTLFESLFTIFR